MISRRWAFIITIIGIFILLLIMVFAKEIKVKDAGDLKNLEINKKVVVKGIILNERKFGDGLLLQLNGKIDALCEGCNFGFIGKEVIVLGRIKEIYGIKKILIHRIVVIQ